MRLLEVPQQNTWIMRAHAAFFHKMATVLKGRFVCNFLFRNSARIISRPALGNYSTEVEADVQSKDKELKVVYKVEDVSNSMSY
jgi:hypothetical protein